MTNWIPKIGDRVIITGTIDRINSIAFNSYRVICDGDTAEESEAWFDYKEISPLVPQQPWDVLREAIPLLGDGPWDTHGILRLANRLEAAAASKPPTLAQAVRGYYEGNGITWKSVMEALVHEESKK